MITRKIVRVKSKADENAYLYRFKEGDIFLRLVKVDEGFELRSPLGTNTVNIIKCKDLVEADANARKVLEEYFEDKVEIKEL